MLVIGAALSAPLVVAPGEQPLTVGPETWDLVEWESVRAGAPFSFAGQAITPCAASDGSVPDAVAELASAVRNASGVDRAFARAEAAVCHTGNASDYAQILFLRGVAECESDGAAAERTFRLARAVHPELAWDEDVAARFRVHFDAATPDGDRHVLEVLPAGEVVSALPLLAGAHLLRAGSGGAKINSSFDDTVVLPEGFPTDALAWVEQDERRGAVSKLLAAHLGEGVDAGVLVNGVIWTGKTGRADWVAQPRVVRDPPPVKISPDPMPPRKLGRSLVVSGLAVGVVGGGLATGAYLAAKPTPDNRVGASWDEGQVKTGRALYNVGKVAGCLGGATLALGLVVSL